MGKKIMEIPKEGFHVLAKTKRSEVASMVIEIDESTGGPSNKHRDSDQWMYVLSGDGVAIIEGEKHSLSPGVLLLIEAGETHEIKNSGTVKLQTLNFYAPPEY